MPSTASWDGRWSGEGRNYVIVRTFRDDVAAAIVAGGPYHHQWGDGWAAGIAVRLMEPGERQAKSDGFCGYDWMVTNIIFYGSPYTTGTFEGAVPR